MDSIEHGPRYEWFQSLRAEWFRMMRPLGDWIPWELRDRVEFTSDQRASAFWGEGLMQEAMPLRREHLLHCRVVPDRVVLLEQLPQGGKVAEVGTSQGVFAREILRIMQPSELHVIDHIIHDRVREFAAESGSIGRVHVHHKDSVSALEAFADGYFDMIYIDAQHAYEGVRRDAETARLKVATDGLLVFNDYTPWSYVEMEPYGVVAAVNELCVERGWEIVYLALPPHMYCDVAVRRIAAAGVAK
jgi:predicted O-methyltransferase YrrM